MTTGPISAQSIEVGDSIPKVPLWFLDDVGKPVAIDSTACLGSGRVVLFAVPGAFTPGCSEQLPGYLESASVLANKGVELIACLAVNDPWVMNAWAEQQGVDERILMLADGNGDFTKAAGMETVAEHIGLGIRSRRYVVVLEDGVVARLAVEQRPGVDVTACARLVEEL